MADAGPPLVVMAVGLVLWLAVTATIAGISIQTIGIILFIVGTVWLVIELSQAGRWSRRRSTVVREERPVAREREIY
jgi:flagellar biogenesis protein FliO